MSAPLRVLPPLPRPTLRERHAQREQPDRPARVHNPEELADWEPRRAHVGEPETAVLTRMETNVLESLCEGKSNKLIGQDYGIAEDTVKSHVRNVMAKLGARDRTHAVALVYSRTVRVKQPW